MDHQTTSKGGVIQPQDPASPATWSERQRAREERMAAELEEQRMQQWEAAYSTLHGQAKGNARSDLGYFDRSLTDTELLAKATDVLAQTPVNGHCMAQIENRQRDIAPAPCALGTSINPKDDEVFAEGARSIVRAGFCANASNIAQRAEFEIHAATLDRNERRDSKVEF